MNAGAKTQQPAARPLLPGQELPLQSPGKAAQKDLEAMALGDPSEAMEIVSGAGQVGQCGGPITGSLHSSPPWHLGFGLCPRNPDLNEEPHR